MKALNIDYRGGSSELANGDLKSTLAFQWALIRKSGSSLLSNITGGKNPATAGSATASNVAGSSVSAATSADTGMHRTVSYQPI